MREETKPVGLKRMATEHFELDLGYYTIIEPEDATIEDGWRVNCAYAYTDDGGIEITGLTLSPSRHVVVEGTRAKREFPQELPPGGITWAVIREQLAIRKIRRHVRALEAGYLRWIGDIGTDPVVISRVRDRIGIPDGKSAPKGRGGRPPSSPEERAQWAKDYLTHDGDRSALAELWSLSLAGVDSRRRILTRDQWVSGTGDIAAPGPKLKAWRKKENT